MRFDIGIFFEVYFSTVKSPLAYFNGSDKTLLTIFMS